MSVSHSPLDRARVVNSPPPANQPGRDQSRPATWVDVETVMLGWTRTDGQQKCNHAAPEADFPSPQGSLCDNQ
ncbi:unnamed protein product [Protopolystoma xenopodis]|uniref:Uncharacterized protein n=1 Tax=Protopolystoma xenopodis TaxID=117903 RepID=A0A3S5AB94_9PLAT|nr:unnamed protein product [Protopolystoma xenopodis]